MFLSKPLLLETYWSQRGSQRHPRGLPRRPALLFVPRCFRKASTRVLIRLLGHRFWMNAPMDELPHRGRNWCPADPGGRMSCCMLLDFPDKSKSHGDRIWKGWWGYAKRQNVSPHPEWGSCFPRTPTPAPSPSPFPATLPYHTIRTIPCHTHHTIPIPYHTNTMSTIL